MQTINVLRYSSAKTKAAVLEEIASANSKDHGTGCCYGGLCVAIESGQSFDLAALVPTEHSLGYFTDRTGARYTCKPANKIDIADAISSADDLKSYLRTQGLSERRTMWRITVEASDIVALSDRVIGGDYYTEYFADGVILRKGATAIKVEAVRY